MLFAKVLATNENMETPVPPAQHVGDDPRDTDMGDLDHLSHAQAIEAEANLVEGGKTIDDIDTGINDAGDAIDTISEVQDNLSADDNVSTGLTEMEQNAVQATHESIMLQLGLSMTLPSLESISHAEQRSKAIATLEEAKKGILTRMADGIRAAGRAVLNFIQGLIRNTWVLRKYYEYVKKKIAKIGNGDTPSQETMTKSASAMSVSGESGMSSVPPMLDTALGLMKISENLVTKLNSMNFKVDGHGFGKMDRDSFVTPNTMPIRNDGKHLGYLTNDRSFSFDAIKSIISANIYSNSLGNYSPNTAESVRVASKHDMEILLSAADKILSALKTFDSKHSKIKTIVSTVINYAVGVVSFYPSLVSKSAATALDKQAELMGIRIALSQGLSRLPLEAFKIAKAFIDYANNSSKYFKAAAATEAPKDMKQIGMRPEKVHSTDWEVA